MQVEDSPTALSGSDEVGHLGSTQMVAADCAEQAEDDDKRQCLWTTLTTK